MLSNFGFNLKVISRKFTFEINFLCFKAFNGKFMTSSRYVECKWRKHMKNNLYLDEKATETALVAE